MLFPGRVGQSSLGGGVPGGRISWRRRAGQSSRGGGLLRPGSGAIRGGAALAAARVRASAAGGWRGRDPAGSRAGRAWGRGREQTPCTRVQCSRRRKSRTRSPVPTRRPSSPGGPGRRWPGCGAFLEGQGPERAGALGRREERGNGAGVRARL